MKNPSLCFYFALASIAGGAAEPSPQAPPPVAGRLSLHRHDDVLTIQFGGRTGPVGIPSWKAILRRDDGGNISALHVPADSAQPLSPRKRLWPITLIIGRNGHGHPGTESRGRESFAQFMASHFEVPEARPDRIVVEIGGTSPNAQFKHTRVYTFGPQGVEMRGTVEPLIELERLGLWTLWNRSELAGRGSAPLAVRTVGQSRWSQLFSSGHDRSVPMPPGVAYPFEAEIALARPVPTFVKLSFDQNFEVVSASRGVVYNVKEDHAIIAMVAATRIPAGKVQTYRYQFCFETR